ncbi:MAG: polyprenyl synthetase family protein [Deltaproteobacteria bacterium]|jgi:octaprenyl-diphosphate synthase|nr:polyprenyl synthetase family protein [Deltaproteobacteria bacterium]MBT6616281.1 polyprenyl synthetase family protein [Deltaproteobacteria bacterium]MBT7152188.1 polyprenyl synthetase family protein [Deltaproteobacteria bacterium]MBT7712039.1 polyprenyl synthetase family protein [Deltaproteobacteria bacterium]MBT7889438.1 polyprenyl synthetase family protein [Deltaproteobacteria bacterium]
MNTQPTIVPLDQILSPIGDHLKKVETLLLKNIETEIPLLSEVGAYILKSGGKRVRPAMLLLATGSVGKITADAYVAACIIEYLHTATLLHDDVVDNADLRRSQKSARTIWGNEASVLVGDYLFGYAFYYLGTLKNMRLVEILSNTSTLMARGEIKQLTRNNQMTTEAEYLDIIYYKTASLMETAMQIGCILGGGSETEQEALLQCGRNIGMAFQLVDDALDYDISNKDLGKEQGVDLKERKITLPLSHLIETVSQAEKSEIEEIMSAAEITDHHVQRICQLMVLHRSGEYTLEQAQVYVKKAKNALDTIADNKYKTSIEQLSEFIVFRKK